MNLSITPPEDILSQAMMAMEAEDDPLLSVLDELPAPIYVTDAEGFVTYFNSACVDFAGRTPVAGKDRWCVTWKLFTDEGEFLPHDSCPMAQAIKNKRPIRGVTAVAERPDGTRVNFQPYPTPLFSRDGELRGAINMLIDITDRRQAESLRYQAERCRRLARGITNKETIAVLLGLADEYEAKAIALNPPA